MTLSNQRDNLVRGFVKEICDALLGEDGELYECPRCGAVALQCGVGYEHGVRCSACRFEGDTFDLVGALYNVSDEDEVRTLAYEVFDEIINSLKGEYEI